VKDTRILHIRSSFFYGGPERQITYLNEALSALRIESGVATFSIDGREEENKYVSALVSMPYPHHTILISSSLDRSAIPALEQVVTENGYTVLVGHDYRSHYFTLTVGRRLGLPAFGYSRGWTSENLKVKFYEWLDVRFLRRLDGVIAVSEAKYGELAGKGISPEQLIYIPNSILTDRRSGETGKIRRQFGIPDDAFLIGTAGRLSREKNQEVFIDAAVRVLREEEEKPFFLLAGTGDRRDALKKRIPADCEEKIILAGWIKDNDSFYADLDMFILTSLTEGFPNVLLEAGKYSLPVVTTRAGGAVEIVDEGNTGYFIPYGGVSELADLIRVIKNDPDHGRRMGRSLAERTRSEFNARTNAEKFLDFVQKRRAERVKSDTKAVR
jgi:glycosyltransferase involved in cell wall biosynthesis